MSSKKRILFPVDLSDNSLESLNFATRLAMDEDASICFLYVEPTLLAVDGMYPAEEMARQLEADLERLKNIKPTDESVEFEHKSIEGNPGPRIVHATKDADLCIMSTHGRSGIFRFLMGSVAEYVLRHAKCPVILVKGFKSGETTESKTDDGSETVANSDDESRVMAIPVTDGNFVTEVMHQVSPANGDDSIEAVLRQLKKAGETGVPVVDCENKCVGILTTTDIETFQNLKRRYESGDQSVISEMFEADEFGQFRCGNIDFGNVERHMTSEVISVRNNESIEAARKQFAANPDIHHLLVLDEDDHPVGIIDAADMPKATQANQN
ncbi:universal stress protein [Mariniblastus fucicola]|uniref:Universal stress protein F n=1 Tax=Mariniblastus fucicola TaxID=980251 RepID=A0A5B9P2R6_9BACT|nr:universal stress protein [Mariniblastus fucicola]QEG20444.1 Universal stress protein F [Mariniblastus fucicola]